MNKRHAMVKAAIGAMTVWRGEEDDGQQVSTRSLGS